MGFNTNKVNHQFLDNYKELDTFRLEELIEGVIPHNLIDQSIINKMFQEELLSLLKLRDIYEVSKGIINLENRINKLENLVQLDLELPNLKVFYESLAPVFLQALIESEGEESFENARMTMLEALRIAIEEELSVWQEKTA